MSKNVFEAFHKMNLDDEANKTHNLVVSPYFLSAQKTKQGGEVRMGISDESLWELTNGKAMCVLLVLDLDEYNKLMK